MFQHIFTKADHTLRNETSEPDFDDHCAWDGVIRVSDDNGLDLVEVH